MKLSLKEFTWKDGVVLALLGATAAALQFLVGKPDLASDVMTWGMAFLAGRGITSRKD